VPIYLNNQREELVSLRDTDLNMTMGYIQAFQLTTQVLEPDFEEEIKQDAQANCDKIRTGIASNEEKKRYLKRSKALATALRCINEDDATPKEMKEDIQKSIGLDSFRDDIEFTLGHVDDNESY
jgi:hypothetical protein